MIIYNCIHQPNIAAHYLSPCTASLRNSELTSLLICRARSFLRGSWRGQQLSDRKKVTLINLLQTRKSRIREENEVMDSFRRVGAVLELPAAPPPPLWLDGFPHR